MKGSTQLSFTAKFFLHVLTGDFLHDLKFTAAKLHCNLGRFCCIAHHKFWSFSMVCSIKMLFDYWYRFNSDVWMIFVRIYDGLRPWKPFQIWSISTWNFSDIREIISCQVTYKQIGNAAKMAAEIDNSRWNFGKQNQIRNNQWPYHDLPLLPTNNDNIAY